MATDREIGVLLASASEVDAAWEAAEDDLGPAQVARLDLPSGAVVLVARDTIPNQMLATTAASASDRVLGNELRSELRFDGPWKGFEARPKRVRRTPGARANPKPKRHTAAKAKRATGGGRPVAEPPPKRALALTPAERQVARLLAKGMSVEEIARVRGVKAGSVKKTIQAIQRKLALRRGSDAPASSESELSSARPTAGKAARTQAKRAPSKKSKWRP